MVGNGEVTDLIEQEVEEVNVLLQSHGFSPVSSPTVRIFTKAMIKGKDFFSKHRKRVKKHNSYTITYTSQSSSINNGIIEKFLCVNSHSIVCVINLSVQSTGPPYIIPDTVCTQRSKKLLFSNYLTYTEGQKSFVFMDQILHKCINLSNNNWNVLTCAVNNVEFE